MGREEGGFYFDGFWVWEGSFFILTIFVLGEGFLDAWEDGKFF